MSWTDVKNPFRSFEDLAGQYVSRPADPTFQFDVWEKTASFPDGRWMRNVTRLSLLAGSCELRIVFAPLDFPKSRTKQAFLDLFNVLGIHNDFAEERVSSVSHSLGARTDSCGWRIWFHFLCKHIKLRQTGAPEVEYHRGADRWRAAAVNAHADLRAGNNSHQGHLDQADYSYLRSGFFLRTTAQSNTLVCFGRTQATARLEEFIENRSAWNDALLEPLVLFDLILEGLFHEVDQNVWNMNRLFGFLEHRTLTFADSSNCTEPPFVGLHNVAKHMIHLAEAVESSLLVATGLAEHISRRENAQTDSETLEAMKRVRMQLRERLCYQKSLFESTKLRLNSLQKRVDNAINLAFNAVTQRDSQLMMRDSNTMKVIAAITLCFLPLTTVATVMGSQLFLVDGTGGSPRVSPSPIFAMFWYIAAIVTVISISLAAGWHWKLWRRHSK